MTQWSAFYFTHSTSYYPVHSTQIHLQDFPRMTQQNLSVMSSADQDLMRNWANQGTCVRQRTVRQETTKYKAGTLPLYQTAVHRGERLEFAPVETSRTTWIFKGRGKRRRAYIEGPRRRSALRIRWRLLRQRLWWFLQWRKMVPFVICRTRNSVSFLHQNKAFALDVIFQKEMVCNFCLKKNVRLFIREAWNAYFIFREMWKHSFIFRETWSRPPFTTLRLKKKVSATATVAKTSQLKSVSTLFRNSSLWIYSMSF